MRISILIGRFPPGVVGGAELQAEAWARRLAVNHDVNVITRLDPPSQDAEESRDGFRVHRIRPSRIPMWRSLRDVHGIDRRIGRLRPPPDVLLCFQTWISGLAGVLAARGGIPSVVWIRGENEYRLERSAWMRRVAPHVWRRSRLVLVQNDANLERFRAALGRHVPAHAGEILARTRVVPNGIELPEGPFRRGDRVLSVGRLISNKGMDVVIEAAAGTRAPLTIAGDGPERSRLVALAARHGVDARFTGNLGRAELAEHYASARACVLAARQGEGMPNVLLEAMSWARPVVATAVGGVSDLIRHERNALLVPVDDPSAVRGALDRLANEPGLADRLGAAARKTAEEFAWPAVQPKLEAVLEEATR